MWLCGVMRVCAWGRNNGHRCWWNRVRGGVYSLAEVISIDQLSYVPIALLHLFLYKYVLSSKYFCIFATLKSVSLYNTYRELN